MKVSLPLNAALLNCLGSYFINKNPRYFPYVLNFLRTGRADLDGLEQSNLDKAFDLFNYFQLEVPRANLSWDATKCGPYLWLDEDNRVVLRQRVHGSRDCVTAVLATQSVNRYSVRLERDLLVRSTTALIGFASRDAFDINGQNSLNGWFLELTSGTLISESTYNKPYTSSLLPGDVLTVVHDTLRNEISFERDGKGLGIAFTDVPRERLHPALDLCCSNLDSDAESESESDLPSSKSALVLLRFCC